MHENYTLPAWPDGTFVLIITLQKYGLTRKMSRTDLIKLEELVTVSNFNQAPQLSTRELYTKKDRTV